MSTGLPAQRPSSQEPAGYASHMRRWPDEPFRLVADIAPVLMWLSDAEHGCTYVNEPWAAFTGRAKETLLGSGWRESIHPDDLPRHLESLRLSIERREPFTVESRLRRHDGEYRWMLASAMPRLAPDGSLTGHVGSCVEIDDLKRAQAEVAQSRERLHLALQSAKSLAWEWDLKAGRDVCFGDLHTILGMPANTVVGPIDDFYRSLHPDDRARVVNAIERAERGGAVYEEEFRVRWKNGTVRWVSSKGRVFFSSDGQAVSMLGIATDITDRKRAEESLGRKESELAEAQRLAAIGSWQWDSTTKAVTWSDELYRIAGLDRDSTAMADGNHPQLYPPAHWERIALAADEAMRSGTPYELDVEMLTPAGSRKWITARGAPRRDEQGRIVGLHGTVQDITERRQAQQALRESEERLRLAVEAGKMFAYTWEAATDLITRSGESSQILGISAGTPLTGQQVLAKVHPDDRERLLAAINALTPEHPQLIVSYRTIRPDGSVIWVERCSRAYFGENGAPARIIGMVADVTERKLAEEALSSVSRRLIEAQEAERARIARDLHDDIGQRLALLSVRLEQLRGAAWDSPAALHARIDALLNQTAEIAVDVQALSHDLHSSRLQLLGVVAAIEGFCAEIIEQQKVTIDFTHEGVPRDVPPDVGLCLFRVLQEALRNAGRHSQVRNFTVHLRATSDTIGLTVRDAGRGFDVHAVSQRGGLGLTSMRERLKLVGGDLTIDSQPAKGTTIVARVPLPASRRRSPPEGARGV
jgi:PAS domain S-box-containing protein